MPPVPPFVVVLLGPSGTPQPQRLARAAGVAGAAGCLSAGDPVPPGLPSLAVLIDPDDGLDGAELADAVHRVLACLPDGGCAVLARPVTDTLKAVDGDGVLRGTADREAYRWLSTPLAGPLAVVTAAAGVAATGAGPGAARELPAVLDQLARQGCEVRAVPA